MAIYKARGIILARRNFFEADRIITVLTKYRGKLNIIAKGVRKHLSKNAGAIELFVLCDLVLAEGRNFDILASAQIVKSFKNLRANLKKTAIAYQVAEISNAILEENQRHIDIYNLCKRILSYLDGAHISKNNLIFEYYAFRSLSDIGFTPQLKVCVDCGGELKEGKNFFSAKDGGILCERCIASDKMVIGIEPNQIKLLRLFLERDISYFSRIKIREKDRSFLRKIINYYLKYIIERELKSGKFIERINRLGQGE